MYTTTKIRRRILGKYQGIKGGPLLVCIAGMHGNEPAGVRALDLFFKMLEVEPITNPSFQLKGAVMGVLGNKMAYHYGQRYIERDLNRSLFSDRVSDIMSRGKSHFKDEDIEIYKLIRTIEKEIQSYQPTQLVILDLHTTTANGGIFSIATEQNRDSLHLAEKLKAPVIYGIDNALKGTTLEYFNQSFHGLPTYAVCFEAGQHEDPLSINRTIAVIVNALLALDVIPAHMVENEHNKILSTYARGLPKKCRIQHVHRILESDRFIMKPGYHNFQPIVQGEHLADDCNGPILSPMDGRILMPLYQKQGNDGFFICTEDGDEFF